MSDRLHVLLRHHFARDLRCGLDGVQRDLRLGGSGRVDALLDGDDGAHHHRQVLGDEGNNAECVHLESPSCGSVGNSVSTSGCSQRRSALAPYESHIWIAALMRATSGSANSNSLQGMESAGFHTARSWPATISRFNSTAFSSSASSAMRSWTAQIARIEPTSARCAPKSACRFRRWVWSSVNFIGLPFE